MNQGSLGASVRPDVPYGFPCGALFSVNPAGMCAATSLPGAEGRGRDVEAPSESCRSSRQNSRQRSNSCGGRSRAKHASRTTACSVLSKSPSAPPMMMPIWMTARASAGFFLALATS